MGKPADPVTGLTIVGARAYDPGLGRFLSADPILNPAATQTLNGYSYTADDPVSQADPSGLMLPGGAQCGIIASEPCQGGGGGGHHNPGGGGPGPGPGSGCDPYIQICGGGQGSWGQGGDGGGQPYCPPQICRTGTYAPAPDLHPAAVHDTPGQASTGIAGRCAWVGESRLNGCTPVPQHFGRGGSGFSIGLCLSGLFGGGADIGGSGCLVLAVNTRAHTVQFGATATGGGGLGVPTLGGGVTGFVSNANTISQLGGKFADIGGSGDIGGVTAGGDVATGLDSHNHAITEGSATVGLGVRLPFVAIGWETHGLFTDTFTGTFFNWHF